LELCDLINRSDSEALFVAPKMASLIKTVQDNCPGVRLYVILGEKPSSDDSPAISFTEFIAEESGAALPESERPEADDVSTIIFTSGTTGKPKGVMLSQRNLYDDVVNVIVTFEPGTTMLSVLPIHHAYCLVMDWLKGFSSGASIFINDSLLHMMRNIRKVQPQIMLMVPLMIETIGKRLAEVDADAPKEAIAKQVLGENLEYIFSGGAHLDPSYIELFDSYGIKVCEGYGMSECSPTISTNGENGNRPGSVGKLLANMQVRFVDGEIQVKGSNVMKGYYKMPKETEEAFSDGWLRTGDLGRMDEDGYLYITGRLKNLIILSNGENISPEEVENELLSNKLVGEVVIAGEDNGLAARIFPDAEVVEAEEISSEEVAKQLQEILDAYNKTQPTYRAITALKIRKFPFIKNTTKKIVRAKMDIDEDPEAAAL
jgi:long-chain acyl-CoA synthetase